MGHWGPGSLCGRYAVIVCWSLLSVINVGQMLCVAQGVWWRLKPGTLKKPQLGAATQRGKLDAVLSLLVIFSLLWCLLTREVRRAAIGYCIGARISDDGSMMSEDDNEEWCLLHCSEWG